VWLVGCYGEGIIAGVVTEGGSCVCSGKEDFYISYMNKKYKEVEKK